MIGIRMFNVGDRVRAIGRVDGTDLTGQIRTVKAIVIENNNPIGVEFDEPFSGGHNLDGRLIYNRGRYGKENEFELITPSETVKEKNMSDCAKTVASDDIPKKLSLMERLGASAENKTLIKAGYMAGGEYTQKAKDLATILFLESQKAKLVEIAQEELDEVKE